jgi:hypothetical protein
MNSERTTSAVLSACSRTVPSRSRATSSGSGMAMSPTVERSTRLSKPGGQSASSANRKRCSSTSASSMSPSQTSNVHLCDAIAMCTIPIWGTLDARGPICLSVRRPRDRARPDAMDRRSLQLQRSRLSVVATHRALQPRHVRRSQDASADARTDLPRCAHVSSGKPHRSAHLATRLGRLRGYRSYGSYVRNRYGFGQVVVSMSASPVGA